jgi:hypothetical protein
MPDLSHAVPLLSWSAILETLDNLRPTQAQLQEAGQENRTLLPPVSLEQLERPTPDFVRRILTFFVEELLTVSGYAKPLELTLDARLYVCNKSAAVHT